MNFKETLCEQKKEHSFCSTQFNLPSHLAAEIMCWGKEVIDNKSIYNDAQQDKGRETEVHVTVLYGLHKGTLPKVKEAIKDAKSFLIKLGKLSKFSAPAFDVIKFEVDSPGIIRLNRLISDDCPYTTNFPKYVPHITLAYVHKNSCDHLLGNEKFLGKRFIAKELLFSDTERKKTKLQLN